MKIAISSHSFYKDILAGKITQFDTLSKAKEMGISGMEFTEIIATSYEEQVEIAKRIREEAEKIDMPIVAYAIGASLYQETEEDSLKEVNRIKKQLDIAKILNAPIMRHDVCNTLIKKGNGRSFDLMLPTIAANAQKVADYGAAIGIRTCSENHGFIAQDSDRIERLFNTVNHENYGVLVDIGNFATVDENSVTAVSRLAPYAIHAHVKDFIISNKKSDRCQIQTRGCNYLGYTAIGEGHMNVKQCLNILKSAGYDEYVSIESPEYTKESFINLNRLID